MDPNTQHNNSLVSIRSFPGVSTEWPALELSPQYRVPEESAPTIDEPLGFLSDAANDAIAIVEGSKSGRLTPLLEDLLSAERSPTPEDQTQGKRRKLNDKCNDIPGYSCFNLNGEPCEAPSGKGRKGPLNESTRKKVATVRGLGACYRCRWQRKPCSGGRPCVRCHEAVSSKKQSECLRWMDCFVLSLLEINPCVLCPIGDRLRLSCSHDTNDYPRPFSRGGQDVGGHQIYSAIEPQHVLRWLEAEINFLGNVTRNSIFLTQTEAIPATRSNHGQRKHSLSHCCCNASPFLEVLIMQLVIMEPLLSIEPRGGTSQHKDSLSTIIKKLQPLSPCGNISATEHRRDNFISSLILFNLERVLQPSSLRAHSQESAVEIILVITLILCGLDVYPGARMNDMQLSPDLEHLLRILVHFLELLQTRIGAPTSSTMTNIKGHIAGFFFKPDIMTRCLWRYFARSIGEESTNS